MKIRKLWIATLAFSGAAVLAQNKKAEPAKREPVVAVAQPAVSAETPAAATAAEFSMFGTLGVAYAEGTYVLTAGGPKFGIRFGDFGLYAGLFPSLVYSDVYKNASAATPVRPNLGAGFELGFKRVSIIAPVYYMPNNTYYYTIGLAYKFS